MGKGYYMPPGELLELYQLVRMYRARFEGDTRTDLTSFLSEIGEKYQKITGKSIETARNPRGAGRKGQYTEDKGKEVKAVYEACKSVRQTARETGVSTTFVYKVIKG